MDYVVFDGLSEHGSIREVVFIEVKTNKSSLNHREKAIKQAKKIIKYNKGVAAQPIFEEQANKKKELDKLTSVMFRGEDLEPIELIH